MSQIVTRIIYYLSDINKLYTKGYGKKKDKEYIFFSQSKSQKKENEMLRSERKTFLGNPSSTRPNCQWR